MCQHCTGRSVSCFNAEMARIWNDVKPHPNLGGLALTGIEHRNSWQGEYREHFEGAAIEILFLCLARNCAGTLPVFFDFLKLLEKCEFRVAVIVGENGSSDATRRLLEAMAGERVQLLDTSAMAGAASRLGRMALGRQALLEAARARGTHERIVCVADLDNAMTVPPDPQDVREAVRLLDHDRSLFAVGATSWPCYYDLFSLRAPGFEFLESFNAELDQAKKRPWSYYRFHREQIYAVQRRVTKSLPLRCASSFNGFCLYDARAFLLGSYRAANEAAVCEHVSFNLSIGRATGRQMLIWPGLSLDSPVDHRPAGFVRFWLDRARKQLARP
jgi:hypothetical protein